MRTIRHRLIVSLLKGRFEPLDTVLFVSTLVHGVWVLSYLRVVAESLAQSAFLVAFGGSLVTCGAVGLYSLHTRNKDMRAKADMWQSMLWLFFSILVFLDDGVRFGYWFGYLTLALVCATVYLNTSVGVRDERHD